MRGRMNRASYDLRVPEPVSPYGAGGAHRGDHGPGPPARSSGWPQDEIYDAIDAGTLQYRQAHMHGNPVCL
jgi:hypothetical protein